MVVLFNNSLLQLTTDQSVFLRARLRAPMTTDARRHVADGRHHGIHHDTMAAEAAADSKCDVHLTKRLRGVCDANSFGCVANGRAMWVLGCSGNFTCAGESIQCDWFSTQHLLNGRTLCTCRCPPPLQLEFERMPPLDHGSRGALPSAVAPAAAEPETQTHRGWQPPLPGGTSP